MSDRRTSLSAVLSIVMMVAAGYAVVLLGLCAFQSRLVYFPNVPSRAIGPGPDSIGLAYEPVEIITEDGIKLDAWYLPVREPRGTVLFFHGNAGNISHRLDSLKVFNGGFADKARRSAFDGRADTEAGISATPAVWRLVGLPMAQTIAVHDSVCGVSHVAFGRSSA